jgi:two-component system sensor histidine kinase KdpD
MIGSKGISVHVIPGTAPHKAPREKRQLMQGVDARPYLSVLLLVAVLTLTMRGFRLYAEPLFDLVNVALLYLLPVLFCAVRWGRGPSIFAAFLAALSFDIFFVPPELNITVADLRYLLILIIFLAEAVITGSLASRLRNQAEISKRRELRASALYNLSRQIAVETDLHSVMKKAVEAVGNSIQGDAVIYAADTSGGLTPQALTPGARRLLDKRERAVAEWVFQAGEIAGKSTATLSSAEGLFLPLIAEKRKVGTMGVRPWKPEQHLAPEQRRLLEAYAGLTALATAAVG